jgi:hypothetical protein
VRAFVGLSIAQYLINTQHPTPIRHPELVSGSIMQPKPTMRAVKWMLKQVQHDER